MRWTPAFVLALLSLLLFPACAAETDEEPTDDTEEDLTTSLIWPNATSHTNGDAWLRTNHSKITQLRPKVMILLADNQQTPAGVSAFAKTAIAGFAEGSRYHGYSSSTRAPELEYHIVKIADARDGTLNAWPRDWPVKTVNGKFVFDEAGLFSQSFAHHYGEWNAAASRYYALCDLFERGIINELWVVAPRYDGNPMGIYESKARVQVYDASMKPIAGRFDNCAANGCLDTGSDDWGQCKVTARLMELATDRGPGCALHATGHGMEGLRRALPAYHKQSSRFFDFDLDDRLGLPMDSTYDKCVGPGACWAYPDDHTIAKGPGSTVASLHYSAWGGGCGNVHFPPNGRFAYDYGYGRHVKSSCEHYGLHDGTNGHDIRTEYSATNAHVVAYEQKYGDCGGGWQVYMRQSMPGHGTHATNDDGTHMKSWWPYLYY